MCLNLQTRWFPVCSSLSVIVLLLCSLSLLGSVFSICFLGTSCFHWRFVFWRVSLLFLLPLWLSVLPYSSSPVCSSLSSCVFTFSLVLPCSLSAPGVYLSGFPCVLVFLVPWSIFLALFVLDLFVFVAFNNRFLSEHSASFILHLVLTSLLQLRKTSKCHPVGVFLKGLWHLFALLLHKNTDMLIHHVILFIFVVSLYIFAKIAAQKHQTNDWKNINFVSFFCFFLH